MIDKKLNKKRGLILFVNDEISSNRKSFRSTNSYIFFNKRISQILSDAKLSVDFEIILSSNNPSITYSDIFIKQKGRDFGEKFNNAIQSTFNSGYNELLIIGNDSPDLTADHIVKGFEEVSKNKIVIGPSDDGGFYLLGLSCSDYSNPIIGRWNTAYVKCDVLKHYENKELFVFGYLRDIDSEKDLQEWLECGSNVSNLLEIFFDNCNNEKKKKRNIISCINTEQTLFRIQLQKAPPIVLS